jgi:hypothetical protein
LEVIAVSLVGLDVVLAAEPIVIDPRHVGCSSVERPSQWVVIHNEPLMDGQTCRTSA